MRILELRQVWTGDPALLGNFGIFAFLVLISIGFLTTNNESRLFVGAIRYAAILGCLIFILLDLVTWRMKRAFVYGVFVFAILLLDGLILASINESLDIGAANIVRDILVVSIGLAIFSNTERRANKIQIARFYLWYVFLGLFLTWLVGGVKLDFPPRFAFDYASDNIGMDVAYSQGISRFFGFGAIASVYISNQSAKNIKKIFWLLMTGLLVMLAIAGGARGDVLATVGVIGVYLFGVYKRYWYILLLATALVVLLGVQIWDDLAEKFIFFGRLSSIDGGDYGLRDILALDVLGLLADKPKCLAIGCGWGYFQSHYGYDFGWYPHNILLESIVVFGLPITMVLVFAILSGLRIHLKNAGKVDLIVLFYCASVLIGLKSGYIMGEWLTMCLSMYFCGLCFYRLNGSRRE